MRTFTLVETTQIPVSKKKTETCYCYRDETGIEIKFHAHPTRAWIYVLDAGDVKTAKRVIDAFTIAGTDQDKFPGGFDEAISKLKIK